MVRVSTAFAFVVTIALLGCQKEEVKSDPPAPPGVQVEAPPQTVNAQAPGQARAQAPAKAVQAQAVPVPAAPVRLRAGDGREIETQGHTTIMKAEDGRKITATTGGNVVMEDPNRPGAKIVLPAGAVEGLGQ